jgi:hypothetical protein
VATEWISRRRFFQGSALSLSALGVGRPLDALAGVGRRVAARLPNGAARRPVAPFARLVAASPGARQDKERSHRNEHETA